VIIGTCTPSDTSVDVTLLVNPVPIAIFTNNSPICSGDSIELSTALLTGATYNWTGPNSFSSTDQNPVILNSSLTDAGNYTLTITANGCISTTTVNAIVVNNCHTDLSIIKSVNNPTPFVGHDVIFTIVATNNGAYISTGVAVTEILQDGYTFVSSTTTSGVYDVTTGLWNIGTMQPGVSETLEIKVTVNQTGNYVNTVTISGNETDTTTDNNVSIVEPCPTDFFIPEGFSPNKDGINDVFFIRGIVPYTNNTITIFNRWGDKVYEASPYLNTWDGTTDKGINIGSTELPVGTYFYTLDLGDGSEIYKGSIYLNK
jgi:gliding motility-associated-like protein/uncharacterized repeat protein (TIGR01451 family)